MFSSKSFIVSGLTFKFLIHFEFIFVYGFRKCSNFIVLYITVQFSQTTYWRDCFFSIIYSSLLCHKLGYHRCMGVSLCFLFFFHWHLLKCWRGCEENRTLQHCWQKGKFMQQLWGTVWRCLQFSSIAQSCPSLCDPMDCSTPALLAPRVCSNSCPLSRWCYLTIWSLKRNPNSHL